MENLGSIYVDCMNEQTMYVVETPATTYMVSARVMRL